MSTAATAPAGQPAPTPSATATRLDFSTRLPPMLVKELRQGLRTRGFVGSLIGFQTVMMIAFLFACFTAASDRDSYEMATGMFWFLTGALLIAAIPMRGLAGLNSEIEARNLDLLLLTRLDARRIVFGKWVSLMAQALLLVTALLPYGVMRYYLGSVDLLDDLAIIAWMFFACGVLTALGLWVSGWPKALRGVAGLFGGLFLLSFLGSGLSMIFRRGYGGGPGLFFGSSGAAFATALILFNGAVVLGLFLVQAVRRLAPPSDNHAVTTRGLILLLFAPVPLLAALSADSEAQAQFAFASVALTVVCAMELTKFDAPMLAHVRPWRGRGRGPVRALLSWFALPGWPSAALFTAVMLPLVWGGYLLLTATTGTRPYTASPPAWLFAWWLAQGWVALVFPCVLISFVRGLARAAPVAYGIIQGLLGITSVLSLNFAIHGESTRTFAVIFATVTQIFPVTSFWLGLDWFNQSSYGNSQQADVGVVMVGQAVVLGLMLWLVWRRSRPFWETVRAHAARGAEVPPPAT